MKITADLFVLFEQSTDAAYEAIEYHATCRNSTISRSTLMCNFVLQSIDMLGIRDLLLNVPDRNPYHSLSNAKSTSIC
jgi:hypothetical protein